MTRLRPSCRHRSCGIMRQERSLTMGTLAEYCVFARWRGMKSAVIVPSRLDQMRLPQEQRACRTSHLPRHLSSQSFHAYSEHHTQTQSSTICITRAQSTTSRASILHSHPKRTQYLPLASPVIRHALPRLGRHPLPQGLPGAVQGVQDDLLRRAGWQWRRVRRRQWYVRAVACFHVASVSRYQVFGAQNLTCTRRRGPDAAAHLLRAWYPGWKTLQHLSPLVDAAGSCRLASHAGSGRQDALADQDPRRRCRHFVRVLEASRIIEAIRLLTACRIERSCIRTIAPGRKSFVRCQDTSIVPFKECTSPLTVNSRRHKLRPRRPCSRP
jgi:hypothetical protein